MPGNLRSPMPRRRAFASGWKAALGLAGGAALGRFRPIGAQAQMFTAAGAGVNVKLMPAADGGGMVPLRESFAFDPSYAQCIIEDNPAAILFDTFAMGQVRIEAHQFFMAMYASEVALTSVERRPGDFLVANLAGVLDCATYAGTATSSYGDRRVTEPAAYEIEATDGGHGGSLAGDKFAFTVLFDANDAPLNYAIFGPKATFTGDLVAGEITIGLPVAVPVSG